MRQILIIAALLLAIGSVTALGLLVGPFESKEQMLPAAHDPVFYNNLGYELAQQGDLDGAQAAFTRAIELRSGYERARSNLATTAFQSGDYLVAIGQLRWLVKHFPENPSYHFDLAQNLASQARYKDADLSKLQEAAAEFDRADALSPGFPNAKSNADVVRAVIADVWA